MQFHWWHCYKMTAVNLFFCLNRYPWKSNNLIKDKKKFITRNQLSTIHFKYWLTFSYFSTPYRPTNLSTDLKNSSIQKNHSFSLFLLTNFHHQHQFSMEFSSNMNDNPQILALFTWSDLSSTNWKKKYHTNNYVICAWVAKLHRVRSDNWINALQLLPPMTILVHRVIAVI